MGQKHIAVIGGGAAGLFFAINCAEKNPNYKISIFEKSPKLLEKVRISGGGRCNVTHACFNEKQLSKNYPRGERELLGPFHSFYTEQVIEWFEQRGVQLKTEADGRMFPTTDNSETIIECFLKKAKKHRIEIKTLSSVDDLQKEQEQWILTINKTNLLRFDAVFIATGNASRMWDALHKLGHKIIPAVPSLFTFNIKDPRISSLMGIAVKNAKAIVKECKLEEQGPVLITHWGLSGPAILRLSAWGARALAEKQHRFTLTVNWCGDQNYNHALESLKEEKNSHPKKTIFTDVQFEIPNRLWQSLCVAAQIGEKEIWADTPNKKLEALAAQLTHCNFQVTGKSTNKDEFVTAGGIDLKEIDFKTMQSKLLPGVFFGGEVLNIDAITGGFNFQAAWTTAWIAAQNC